MLVVAALVIPALVLEGANVGHGLKRLANVLNWIIWLAFLGELVAMLAVVRDRSRYLRHDLLNVAIVVLTPRFCRRCCRACGRCACGEWFAWPGCCGSRRSSRSPCRCARSSRRAFSRFWSC